MLNIVSPRKAIEGMLHDGGSGATITTALNPCSVRFSKNGNILVRTILIANE